MKRSPATLPFQLDSGMRRGASRNGCPAPTNADPADGGIGCRPRFLFMPTRSIVAVMRTIIPEQKNPALREISREIPVSEIQGKHIQSVIADMKKLLAKEDFGVALAANQVGEPIRLFIVSWRALARGSRNAPDEEDVPDDAPALPDQVYINPELLKMSRGKKPKHEGCLSIRGKWGLVPRAEKASVRAYDEHGVRFTRGASGFLAHIFQHELDHLDGILYTDKADEVYDDADEK
ncbi:peptide deformylase [Candidatus Kaiserbacteria bacterium]|nr:peptide deformylase [Candidatus Kaiserbacteria bacterium]